MARCAATAASSVLTLKVLLLLMTTNVIFMMNGLMGSKTPVTTSNISKAIVFS